MSDSGSLFRALAAILAALILASLAACPSQGRLPFQQGMTLFNEHNFGEALAQFEKSLAANPEQQLALFYKGRCLFELDRYDEAIPVFEEFLSRTEEERAAFSDERYDAEFYRDKAKQELGQEVPQNEEAIPEERMGG